MWGMIRPASDERRPGSIQTRNLVAQDRFSRQFEKGNLHLQRSPILAARPNLEIPNL